MARRAATAAPPPRTEQPPRPGTARRSRPDLRVVRDIEGPRVRLGLLWFAATVAALAVGRVVFAAFLAGAAALAASQVVLLRTPPQRGRPRPLLRGWLEPPMRLPAALGAAALPLAAAAGTPTLTAAAVALPMVAAVYRTFVPGPRGAVDDLGLTMAAAWGAGLVAAAPVLAYGLGPGVAALLVVLVSVYDAGDFIVGTGAHGWWEGPAGGVAAVLVATFTATIVPPSPLGAGDVWVLGAAVGTLAPLGPPAASVLIGDGRTPAGFVRRLDSLLVLGPVWAYAAAALA